MPTSNDVSNVPTPPIPPSEFRRLVCHDDSLFDLTPGAFAIPHLPRQQYESVLDFGCGCGRVARQLLVQEARPRRYAGVDIHRGMIKWCKQNLTPLDSNFQFYHHNVYSLSIAPDNSRNLTLSLPVEDSAFTLVIAHSVFTHLLQEQAKYYLSEVARVLRDDGIARTTWFLFDRSTFPMLADFQACLYVNDLDPTNAVIFDWQWFLATLDSVGLRVQQTIAPALRGFQWDIYLEKRKQNAPHSFEMTEEMFSRLCGSAVKPG